MGPFLRSLDNAVGPHDLCRAVADDLAVVLANLWKFCFAVAAAFREFQNISLFAFKPTKCVLVLSWAANLDHLARLLREAIPAWGTLGYLSAAMLHHAPGVHLLRSTAFGAQNFCE